MKAISKFCILICLAVLICGKARAGSVTLGWDAYANSPTNYADTVRIYAVPGTNTAFSGANVSQWVQASTSITNTSITVLLSSGAWTFTASAYCTTNGLESPLVPTVWTNVPATVVVIPPPPSPPRGLSRFKVLQSNP